MAPDRGSMPARPPEDLRVSGKYELGDRLGAGSFGDLFVGKPPVGDKAPDVLKRKKNSACAPVFFAMRERARALRARAMREQSCAAPDFAIFRIFSRFFRSRSRYARARSVCRCSSRKMQVCSDQNRVEYRCAKSKIA